MASTAARIDVAIGFAPVHRLEAIGRGREGTADVVVAQRDGRNRGELRGVTVNELVKTVHENESIYIPIGAVHRLENPG